LTSEPSAMPKRHHRAVELLLEEFFVQTHQMQDRVELPVMKEQMTPRWMRKQVSQSAMCSPASSPRGPERFRERSFSI